MTDMRDNLTCMDCGREFDEGEQFIRVKKARGINAFEPEGKAQRAAIMENLGCICGECWVDIRRNDLTE